MRYTPQVYRMRDHDDNIRDIGVQYDNDDGTYVATIRGGSFRKMFDGTERQEIVASGTADTPLAAAECAIQNLKDRADAMKAITVTAFTFDSHGNLER